MRNDPKKFETLLNANSHFFAEVSKVLNEFPNCNILDIGCGSGGFAELLSEHHPQINYVGLDIEEGNIEECLKNSNISNNFLFIAEDFLNFETQRRFDIIISYSTLQLIPNSHEVFYKICSLLSESGHVIFAIPTPNFRNYCYLFVRYVSAIIFKIVGFRKVIEWALVYYFRHQYSADVVKQRFHYSIQPPKYFFSQKEQRLFFEKGLFLQNCTLEHPKILGKFTHHIFSYLMK